MTSRRGDALRGSISASNRRNRVNATLELVLEGGFEVADSRRGGQEVTRLSSTSLRRSMSLSTENGF